jgi:hypothetical protein
VAAAKAAWGDQKRERGGMGAAEEEKKRRWRRDMGVVEQWRGIRICLWRCSNPVQSGIQFQFASVYLRILSYDFSNISLPSTLDI